MPVSTDRTTQEPTIDGRRVSVLRDGAAFEDGGQYGGALTVDTLLPEAAELTLVGSAGREFWIEATQTSYATTKADPAEAGAWRVEASPAVPVESDRFLHVLVTGDAGGASPPAGERISGEGMVGARVLDHTVLFADQAELVSTVDVDVTGNGEQRILIADAEPGIWNAERDGQAAGTARVEAEGELLYFVGEPGHYHFAWGEPLPDSGEGGAGGTSSSTNDADSDSSCGCRAAGSGRSAPLGPFCLLAAVLFGRRARRRADAVQPGVGDVSGVPSADRRRRGRHRCAQ